MIVQMLYFNINKSLLFKKKKKFQLCFPHCPYGKNYEDIEPPSPSERTYYRSTSSFKVRPSSNEVVEAISGTACAHHVSVSLQDIISFDEVLGHPTSNKLFGCIQGCIVGNTTCEGPKEGYTNRDGVNRCSMSTNSCPTTTFIHNAVLANKEVVSDVTPFPGIHVIVLYVPGLGAACSSGVTEGPFSVVDDDIRDWSRHLSACGGLASPLCPAYNSWTILSIHSGTEHQQQDSKMNHDDTRTRRSNYFFL